MIHRIIAVLIILAAVGAWTLINRVWVRAIQRRHREEIIRVIERTRREERALTAKAVSKALAGAERVAADADWLPWTDRAIAITRDREPADTTTT